MKRVILVLILVFIIGDIQAKEGELKKLSFAQAYGDGGERLTKELPKIREWADDDHYFQEKEGKLFKTHARSGKSRLVLDPGKYEHILGGDRAFDLLDAADRSADLSRFLFEDEGDIFLFLREEKRLIQVTASEGQEDGAHNPRFSPDGRRAAFTRGGNLFVYDIESGQTRQLTRDGSEEILNGYASWVYYEEILGRRGRYKAFWWSPDNKKIVFMRFDQGGVPIFPIVAAEGTYGELEKQRYPKPGFANPQVTLAFADVETNDVQRIPFSDEDDHYLAFPVWNDASDKLYFQWMNRDQDHMKILVYDLNSRKIWQVYEERQKAWVEFFDKRDFSLLKDGGLLLRSSKDGWFHIYHIAKDGRQTQVTKGDWSVSAIEHVHQEKRLVYFTARREASTDTDFYKAAYPQGKITRLTDSAGTHDVDVSLGGKYVIDRCSSIYRPVRIDLRDNRGRLVKRIADSCSPTLEEYQLARVELFTIQTHDNIELPALWLLPQDLDNSRKYPLIFSVYGGPGASSVRNRWQRLANHYLAQQGIIVFAVDHRGSGHFGKKGMALMHRCLGRWEMHDYSEAAAYLRTLPFVDSERIAITGGSYGGYVAALALTRGSEYFKYGSAAFSVIDWRLYDSVYTERYMDTPQQNPRGYYESSVLSYIDGYRSGTLRIDHGTMDDNVHMQNTLQFVDRVLDAKKSVELMLYPGQRHGYRGEKRRDANRGELSFWSRKFFNREFVYEAKTEENEKP